MQKLSNDFSFVIDSSCSFHPFIRLFVCSFFHRPFVHSLVHNSIRPFIVYSLVHSLIGGGMSSRGGVAPPLQTNSTVCINQCHSTYTVWDFLVCMLIQLRYLHNFFWCLHTSTRIFLWLRHWLTGFLVILFVVHHFNRNLFENYQ